jgi:hypothetical protein
VHRGRGNRKGLAHMRPPTKSTIGSAPAYCPFDLRRTGRAACCVAGRHSRGRGRARSFIWRVVHLSLDVRPWERPLKSTGGDWIYADASAHRLISDFSVLIGQQRGHRIVAAGDLNILYGHGEHGSRYWAARYQTVFDRIAILGMRFVGPQLPNGRKPDPWPDELPRESRNVPTFRTNQQTPATATRQLDFVFASEAIADRVMVRALNQPTRSLGAK